MGQKKGELIKVGKLIALLTILLLIALSVSAFAAADNSGNKETESQLKGALFANPEDPKTNLELGVIYFGRGVYEEAADYFENVIRIAPGTEHAAKAKEHLDLIEKGAKPKRININITLGGQYDSNVILNPETSPLPSDISNKSDWRAIVYLNGRFDLLAGERLGASIGYSFYHSFHAELEDYNLMQHQADFRVRLGISDFLALGAAYTFEYLYLGGDEYDYAHIINPSLTISEGKGFSTVIDYKYRDTHFMDADRFRDNSERTGTNNLVGLTQNIPFGSSAALRIGYSYDTDSTARDYWDYEGHKGFAGLRLNLPYKTMLDLYAEYYRKGYEGANPISGLSRTDTYRAYSASISKAITDRFIITAGHTYIDNDSNIDAYTYVRSITSLFLTVRF